MGVQRDALRHQRCCGGSRHGRAVDWPGESEPTGRARSAATVASPLTGSRFVRQTSRHTTSAERGTSQTQEGGDRGLNR